MDNKEQENINKPEASFTLSQIRLDQITRERICNLTNELNSCAVTLNKCREEMKHLVEIGKLNVTISIAAPDPFQDTAERALSGFINHS